jgi:hypothetical protein
MTIKEAYAIIGNQPIYAIKNMRRALKMLPWCNTPAEQMRLEACEIVLKQNTK